MSKRDLKLLASRLTKRYGKDNAKQLMLKHKNNLWGYHGLAWSLGKRDLFFFNMYFLDNVFTGPGKSELADIHFTMWKIMQDMYVEDTHTQQSFIMPRGIGKTTTGSLSLAIWANVYEYSKYTVLASAINDTATSFINNIRAAIKDNKKIIAAFGDLYDANLVNTTEKIELANKTMIQALSSRSSFRGKTYLNKRIELLILDDFQSEDNVSSREQMEKHWKRFSDDASKAIEENSHKKVAMGTIITPGDFYHRLLNMPTWKSKQAKAVLVDKVEDVFEKGLWKEFKEILYDTDLEDSAAAAKEFYFKHEEEMQYPLLWQDHWSCLNMALKYYENPNSFKQEMQSDFTGEGSRKFKNIVYTDKEINPTVLAIDPATSENKDNDYTAFVAADMQDDRTLVEYAHIERLEFDDYIYNVINILKEYDTIEYVIIEKQTYNTADVIAIKNVIDRDEDLYYRDIEFINEHQSKNKDAKIDSVVGDVNLGRIQFSRKLEGNDAIQQLEDFTGTATSKHDDFPDALAELRIYMKSNNLDNTIEVFDNYLF